jgi:hypothetical protein
MDWISVKDQLPEIGMETVIYDGVSFHVATYKEEGANSDSDWGCDSMGYEYDATHWMPLYLPSA